MRGVSTWRDLIQVSAASVAGMLPMYTSGINPWVQAREQKEAGSSSFDWTMALGDYGGMDDKKTQTLLVNINLCGFFTTQSQPGVGNSGQWGDSRERAFLSGWLPNTAAVRPDYDVVTGMQRGMNNRGFDVIVNDRRGQILYMSDRTPEIRQDGYVSVTQQRDPGEQEWEHFTASYEDTENDFLGSAFLSPDFREDILAHSSYIQLIDRRWNHHAASSDGLFTVALHGLRMINRWIKEAYCP